MKFVEYRIVKKCHDFPLITAFESWRYVNVMLLNTCSRNRRRKHCEESRWRSQSALVWPLAMSWLGAKISFVPKHQLIVPSTLLAPATHIRTDKATKSQRYIRSHHWHIKNSSKGPLCTNKSLTEELRSSMLWLSHLDRVGPDGRGKQSVERKVDPSRIESRRVTLPTREEVSAWRVTTFYACKRLAMHSL